MQRYLSDSLGLSEHERDYIVALSKSAEMMLGIGAVKGWLHMLKVLLAAVKDRTQTVRLVCRLVQVPCTHHA